MRDAEDVTFGTSGLDRVAHLRGQGALLENGLGSHAKILPLWRGKPLVMADADGLVSGLALRKHGAEVLSDALEPPILIGLGDGPDELIFAQDISAWSPPEGADAALNTFLDPSVQTHPAEAGTGAGFRELRAMMSHLSRREAELAATARALVTWHSTHRFCANCGVESAPAQAGWQRDCPACGRHHFPRTDPVVIMLITHGDAVLVGRSPGWPEGMYSLLAGFVEPGETVEAAVRREVFEEAGVQVGAVDYLASQPWPFPASLMLGCRGVATSTEITIDPTEIEAARWVSRADMLEVFAGNHPDIRPARRGAIAHFLLQRWLSDRLD